MTVGPRKEGFRASSTSVGSEAGNLGRWKHYKLNPGGCLLWPVHKSTLNHVSGTPGRGTGGRRHYSADRPDLEQPACPLIATYGKHRRQAIDTACCRSHITRASTQHDWTTATADVSSPPPHVQIWRRCCLAHKLRYSPRSSLQLQLPSSPAINNTLARQSGMPPERVLLPRASSPSPWFSLGARLDFTARQSSFIRTISTPHRRQHACLSCAGPCLVHQYRRGRFDREPHAPRPACGQARLEWRPSL